MATRTEQLLSEFRAELNRLAPAVELVDGMSGYVEIVRERADTIRKETERMLKEAEDIARKNLEDSKKTLEDFSEQNQQEIEPLLKSLADMLKELNRLVDFLKTADIPGRLDRTELRIENLNTSVQNLFGRLDALERVVRDENTRLKETLDQTQVQISGAKTAVYVMGAIQVLCIAGVFIMLLLKN